MGLRISFELTDRDLRFFRKALRQSRIAVKDAEDTEIIDAVHSVLDEIRNSEPLPDFVGKRIPELESLISMLTDEEWQLPQDDRERLLATFVYFADPEDILPDDIPVIGYLDDVIIIELVARELCSQLACVDSFDIVASAFRHRNAGSASLNVLPGRSGDSSTLRYYEGRRYLERLVAMPDGESLVLAALKQ